MKGGDVFRLVKAADRHSKVVISDPQAYPDAVLIVGMTSWDGYEDQSCILNAGDHSTVTHRICIVYSRANVKASNNELDVMLRAGLLQLFEPVSHDVLKAIRDGAMRSTRMAKDLKRMLVDQDLAAVANSE